MFDLLLKQCEVAASQSTVHVHKPKLQGERALNIIKMLDQGPKTSKHFEEELGLSKNALYSTVLWLCSEGFILRKPNKVRVKGNLYFEYEITDKGRRVSSGEQSLVI